MRSAPARGAAVRSGSRTSALVLETEKVTHRVSINHAVGRRGGLFHPNCGEMQEFVQNGSRHGFRGATLGVVQLRAPQLCIANLLRSGTQRGDRRNDLERRLPSAEAI